LDKNSKISFISVKNAELSDLSVMLREKCASLSAVLHPVSFKAVKEIIKIVNAYYSCKSDGHEIDPAEIEKSLSGKYSRKSSKRLMQKEAAAYFETEIEIDDKILNEPNINICSYEFIAWIHGRLFEKLPDEFKRLRGRNSKIIYLIPGELRKEDIFNGNGFAKAKQIRKLLFRFEELFNPVRFSLNDLPAASALAHTMLSWIHPFPAWNSAVLRLFTNAYFKKCGLKAELFSFNRAVSNQTVKYNLVISESYRQIKNLHSVEHIEHDESLTAYCRFFLQTAIDETGYMLNILNHENVMQRLNIYINSLISKGEVRDESRLMLKTVFLSGELKRGEVLQLTGRPERTARRILGELLGKRMLISDTPKGPVRINLSVNSAIELFEGLF
jgi:Fic family protein